MTQTDLEFIQYMPYFMAYALISVHFAVKLNKDFILWKFGDYNIDFITIYFSFWIFFFLWPIIVPALLYLNRKNISLKSKRIPSAR